MDTLKKMVLWFAAIMLGPLVMLGVASFAFTQTIGDPAYIKQTLHDAAIYKALGEQIQVQTRDSKEDERINEVLAKITTGETIEQIGNQSIDQVFGFLSGEQKAEDIAIDITPLTSQLNDELVKQIEGEITKEIKSCRRKQKAGSNVSCKELEAQADDAQKFVDEAFGKDGVLADGNVTLQDIQTLNAQGKQSPTASQPELTESLEALAALYQLARWGMVICGILSLTCIAGIIFCSHEKLHGVRRASVVLLINSAFIVILAVSGEIIAQKSVASFIDPNNNLANAAGLAGSTVVADMAVYNRNIGLMLLVISVIGLTVSWIMIKKRPEQKPSQTPETTTPKPEPAAKPPRS